MVGDGDKDVTWSVRVDEATDEQWDTAEYGSKSTAIRQMVHALQLRGDTVEVGLERRLEIERKKLERLRLQRAQLDTDIEAQEHEIETVEQLLSERRSSTPSEVIEYAAGIGSGRFPAESLDPENAACRNWARKAGLPVGEFIAMVEVRL